MLEHWKCCDRDEGYELIYHGVSNHNAVVIIVGADLHSHVAEVQQHFNYLILAVIDPAAY